MKQKPTYEELEKRIEELESTQRKNEAFFRKIIDLIPSCIIVKNRDGQFVLVNEKTATFYGPDIEGMIGRYEYEYAGLHPSNQAEIEKFLADDRTVIDSGKPKTIPEEKFTLRNGERHTFVVSKIPVSTFGYENCVLVVASDITERKQMEVSLKESEEKYQSIIEDLPALVCSFLPSGEITFVNKAYCDFFNKKYKNLVGSNFLELIPEFQRKDVKKNIDSLTVESPVMSHKHAVKTANNEIRWQRWTNRAISDRQIPGNIIGYQSIGEDITERKRLEDELIKKEKLHNQAQSVAKLGHWELKSPSGTPTWSDEIFRIFGLDPQKSEPSFAAHKNIIHEDDWGVLQQSIQNLSTEGEPFDIEFRILRPDGEIRWMRAKGSADKGQAGAVTSMFGTAQDITDHKAVEEALKKSKERFSLAMEASKDGIWDWDLTTGDIYCSPGLTSMLGYDSNDIIENVDEWQGMIHPQDRQKAYQANIDCVNGLTDSFEVEYRMKTKDGGLKWVLGRGQAAYRDASGRAVRMIGTHQDITEKKKAETVLRERNLFIQTILDNLPIGLAVNYFDKGTATYMNKQFEKIYGWPQEELKNTPDFFKNVFPDPVYRKKIQNQVLQDILSRDPKRMQWDNIEATAKDGKKTYYFGKKYSSF